MFHPLIQPVWTSCPSYMAIIYEEIKQILCLPSKNPLSNHLHGIEDCHNLPSFYLFTLAHLRFYFLWLMTSDNCKSRDERNGMEWGTRYTREQMPAGRSQRFSVPPARNSVFLDHLHNEFPHWALLLSNITPTSWLFQSQVAHSHLHQQPLGYSYWSSFTTTKASTRLIWPKEPHVFTFRVTLHYVCAWYYHVQAWYNHSIACG